MLQSTHLIGISSLRFRHCQVDEEARVLFSKFLLLLSCFTFRMIAPQTFSKIGVSHVPSVSKAHSWVLSIQILTPRRWVSKNHIGFMNIQLSKLGLLLVGLDHRVQTFLFTCLILPKDQHPVKGGVWRAQVCQGCWLSQLFSMHHFLQKAFERNVFRENRFHKWSESGFTKSKGF